MISSVMSSSRCTASVCPSSPSTWMLDAPPHPDEDGAQLVRLRSRQRDTRPAGVVDELIGHTQARQQSAAPTKPKAASSRADEDTVAGAEMTSEGTGSARRQKKKRGSGGHT